MEKVAVLLSTYNGEKFLREQLDSLYSQEGVQLEILVRDDGSKDSTQKILNEEQEKGKLRWYTGKNLGPAKSFMDLVENAPEADYYAFCDQDDVWLPDKLKIAVEWLKKQDASKALLYYGSTRVVDADLKPVTKKSKAVKILTYEGMLISSNCTGCTMVFNKILLNLAKGHSPKFIFMHDGWLHKICLLANGQMHYDEDVHILYRQHGHNVVGAKQSCIAKIKRRWKALRRKECIRSKGIAELLRCYGNQMSAEQKSLAEEVANYNSSLGGRLKLFFDRRIKTGYFGRDIMFRLAVLTGAF